MFVKENQDRKKKSRADKALINRAVNAIYWEEQFANKTVEPQVSELNELLLNIYSNCITNQTVLCDPKYPLWMTNGIKTVIEMKNNAYKEYIKSNMRHDYYVLFCLSFCDSSNNHQNVISLIMEKLEEDVYHGFQLKLP